MANSNTDTKKQLNTKKKNAIRGRPPDTERQKERKKERKKHQKVQNISIIKHFFLKLSNPLLPFQNQTCLKPDELTVATHSTCQQSYQSNPVNLPHCKYFSIG